MGATENSSYESMNMLLWFYKTFIVCVFFVFLKDHFSSSLRTKSCADGDPESQLAYNIISHAYLQLLVQIHCSD